MTHGMTAEHLLAERLQARLDATYPGRYRAEPASAGGVCVVTTDDGAHGARFLTDALGPLDPALAGPALDAAVDRVCRVVDRVIHEGLPSPRAGEYVAYDLSV